MPCAIDFMQEEGACCALGMEEMQSICDVVLAEEGVERTCLLSLSVVLDASMRELNAQWRNIDRPTDVLSLECERPDDPSLADGEPCELGDVVLAPAYIARQAQEYGTTEKDETRLLLIHGLLHLLGYDHLDDEEARVMEAREDELLEHVATDARLSAIEFTRHSEEVLG